MTDEKTKMRRSGGGEIEVRIGDICDIGTCLALWCGSKTPTGWINLSDNPHLGEYNGGWMIDEVVGNIRDMGPALQAALREAKK